MVEKDERKSRSRASKQAHAVIDRIEDAGQAVLFIGDDEEIQAHLPVSLLPEGARDGDHLRITITIDKGSREDAEKSIKRLQEELKEEGGTQGKKDFKL